MKRDAIRQLFVGMDVIYIYHNQIDARGDKANTENEVLLLEEAINEIHDLIRQLTDHVSATHYIVTADHGFIYKRDKRRKAIRSRIFPRKDRLLTGVLLYPINQFWGWYCFAIKPNSWQS